METLLVIKTSRLTSFKGMFFPMKYEFVKDENGKLIITLISRNWIGQKTRVKESAVYFAIKGIILRKLYFSRTSKTKGYVYGRFWFSDCKKAKNIMEEYTSPQSRIEWSDVWF